MTYLFQTECDPPDVGVRLPDSSLTNEIVRYEEEGTLWLWAWPELIGWDYDIVWLFSPVVGRDKRPGDLWGLDSRGHLILVETKRGAGRTDPFEDFVPFDDASELATAAGLEKYWYRLHSSERIFIENKLHTLDIELNNAKQARGVVPYSYKRFVVRRWRDLYRGVIAPWLSSSAYTDKVYKYLDARRRQSISQTHYIGMITAPKYGAYKLSSRGVQHYKQLQEKAKTSRISLIATTAKQISEQKVNIMSWELALP